MDIRESGDQGGKRALPHHHHADRISSTTEDKSPQIKPQLYTEIREYRERTSCAAGGFGYHLIATGTL
jgi:hypothetical protein